MQQYPDMAAAHFEPADVQLLALFAGAETDRASARSMPYIQTFQQYWQPLLEHGCAPPQLAQKVGVKNGLVQWRLQAPVCINTVKHMLFLATPEPLLMQMLGRQHQQLGEVERSAFHTLPVISLCAAGLRNVS